MNKPTVPNSRVTTKEANEFLPLLPSGHGQRTFQSPTYRPARRLYDASSVVSAYDDMVAQSQAMVITHECNRINRQCQYNVFKTGLKQLSDSRMEKEKKAVRFNMLKNEIDTFQQSLEPFVYKMATSHEHGVHSSVYRSFVRMQAVQDMGIPIYSLGAHIPEPTDKVMMPRTFQSFYRRIRRRNAADFIDTDLIPRPRRKSAEREISKT